MTVDGAGALADCCGNDAGRPGYAPPRQRTGDDFMTASEPSIGDRVGIKDSADFAHWSARGSVVGVAEGGFSVVADGEAEAVTVPRSLLVSLGPPGSEASLGEWVAQAFPLNGDPPGVPMYFANGADVLAFVRQFRAAEIDETIKVRPPASATDAERQAVRTAGAQEL
jgi:hypothetical protein